MATLDLVERAKHRRAMAALALRKYASKKTLTPDELRKAIESVKEIQSEFGAPFNAQGEPVGKAGRTISTIKKWLTEKAEFGLPPVGKAFDEFVHSEMNKAGYLYGHDELAIDTAKDIARNFGFDPRLVEIESAPVTEEVRPLTSMPQVVSRSVKPFVRAEAYEPSKKEDVFKLPEVPVVTRVDYEEDIEKAKAAGEMPKQPLWNKRNPAINDLLNDLSAKDYERDSEAVKQEEKQIKEYTKADPYPTIPKEEKSKVRAFSAQPTLRSFAGVSYTAEDIKFNEDFAAKELEKAIEEALATLNRERDDLVARNYEQWGRRAEGGSWYEWLAGEPKPTREDAIERVKQEDADDQLEHDDPKQFWAQRGVERQAKKN